MNKKINIRKYFAVCVELCSPLNISNGQNYATDSDVLRNHSGELFIPGTSLAGAFRNYLGVNKDKNCIMGYSEGEKGRMSALFISDLYLDGAKLSVRDGVKLTEEKTVENKFDMEIIETGAQGILFLHYVVREGDRQQEFESVVHTVIQELHNGTIRLGANKNRGFGRIKVKKVYQREFKKEDVDGWISFMEDWKNLDRYCIDGQTDASYQAWLKDKEKPQMKYIKIRIPLKLTGGISIRRYSARPNQSDFEHITCNGKPVIPGTSWNGAIRADAREILHALGCSHTEKTLGEWFGNIKEDNAHQSRIVIAESEISGAKRLTMTRNKVNRFDASTADGALYSEDAYFGGNTCLELLIKKDKEKEYLALLGMLKLIITDIQKGYIAVGGQTAVGRGIFTADQERNIEYSEEIPEETCMSALYAVIV